MRKFWFWLIPLIFVGIASVGIVVGLSVAKNADANSNKTIFATDISWNCEPLILTKGSSYAISQNDIVIEPKNCTQTVAYSTSNKSILQVNPSTGEIFALEVGECYLVATIQTSETTTKMAKINVVVNVGDGGAGGKTTRNEEPLVFQLSQGFASFSYQADSSFDSCAFNVVSGGECISIYDEDSAYVYVLLHAVGEAEIDIETPTEIIKFPIRID